MESRIKEYKKITINDYRNYEPEKDGISIDYE